MVNKEKISREGLLKIVLDNLSSCNFKSENDKNREKIMEIIHGRSSSVIHDPNQIIENMGSKKIDPEKVIEKIKKAFVEAGLEREFKRLEARYKEIGFSRFYEYLCCEYIKEFNGSGDYRGWYVRRDEGLKYEEILKHLSSLECDLLKIISNNISVDESYDTNIISDFVSDYLAGFIYDYNYVTSSQLNMMGIRMIETLYDFYGLSLTDEEKEIIIEIHKEEYKNFKEKRKLGYEIFQVYKPDILNKYIVEDIIKKLALRKEKQETQEVVVEQPKKTDDVISSVEVGVDVANLTVDEKIALIKQKLEQLENLSKQEKELLGELDKIRAAQKQLLEEVNGMKL